MYKLAIFEDEPLILNSLCYNIDWTSADCKIVGKSYDGSKACRIIEEQRPDIVITDIQMGDTNGLDLCRWMNEKYPDIKKIIITGYGTVQYAKEAFKSQVTDFILKPIDRSELLHAVTKAANELNEQRNLRQNLDELTHTLSDYKSQLIEKFLIELAAGQSCDSETMCERIRELDICLNGYFCIVLDTEGALNRTANYADILRILNLELQYGALVEHFKCAHYCLFQQRYYCICEISSSQQNVDRSCLMQMIQTDILDLQDRLIAVFNCPFRIYYSDIYQYPHEFYTCFQQVNRMIEQKFFVNKKNILSEKNGIHEKKELDPAELRKWSEYIISHLALADRDATFKALDQLWSQMSLLSEEEAKYKCLAFFVSFKERIEAYQLTTEPVLTTDMLIRAFRRQDSFYEIRENFFVPLMNHCLEQRRSLLNRPRSISAQVRDYVRENIEQQLNVTVIAEHFNYNPKYLSMMVKKECGQTILDIITDIRVERAEELLRTTHERTYQIAQQVGIADSKYFSQIFRKKTGMTPREYRTQRDAEA